MSQSVYQKVCSHIVDGTIDPHFVLKDPSDTPEFTWAPGSRDGIYWYHRSEKDFDGDAYRQLARAVKAAGRKDFEEADRLFASLCELHRAITIDDELQRYIITHAGHLDPDDIYHAAMYLLYFSENIECVKIALEMLQMLGEPDDETKEIIRRLGLYDEFTLFCLWNVFKWPDGNEEVFSLAKKVHGWGLIHALSYLKPETPEIRAFMNTPECRSALAGLDYEEG